MDLEEIDAAIQEFCLQSKISRLDEETEPLLCYELSYEFVAG
jgi:hypothetical protein